MVAAASDSTANLAVNDHPKLAGKVAIITGGASGIGEATARLFANEGALIIVIADIQDELGKQVAASIGTDKCSYVHCDVADEDEVKHLVESTVNTYGRLDIMFSNAGVASASEQTILDLNFSEMDRLFAVNVRGMAACVKHAARAMVEKQVRGSIVCTASVAGSNGFPIGTDYCMSKHAVVGLIRSASVQLAARGIRVNSVSPTAIATPLLCNGIGLSSEEAREFCRKCARLEGVELTPELLAKSVLFLASNDSDFITGHDLKVDGSLASF
ncbi:(-)-isopiperitenol/(-)-carveol dehydrogenase, mitochondrial-like [Prosopis cineraria]|uniref:(-)-isopiperitenol/(-)-carveol dehydrogenase, mitochondrial-like n=1 Tax=Prosopis cineraria TaxID=364024 RepID=UPI00240F454A|nr:(-)-isopiperitenol/(-)-carveol dehydrogenase, mitochondrial-like [Prosopis cineraria]